MKNNIVTPKTIMLLLAFMPIVLKAQGQLLYESIYSMTGICWQDDGTVMKTNNHSAFYSKIYENCLVETSGLPNPQDYYYYYIGNNNQNSRVYQNNRVFILLIKTTILQGLSSRMIIDLVLMWRNIFIMKS